MTQSDLEAPRGLSEEEALERLERDGYNEIASGKRRNLAALVIEVMREPMFLLLVACGAIYFLLGDVKEACVLLGFVLLVVGITLYQERKTERALDALRDLSSPRALVIRDGEARRIPGREVVVDDVLVLAEGDRVPADAVLFSCTNLSADESLLTGESVPVRKSHCGDVIEMGLPGGDDQPFVYSGTLVVQGQGLARVRGIGLNTELGKIGKAIASVEEESALLQKETGRLVRIVSVFGLGLCSLVVVLYGLTRGEWLTGVLSGITLAMAILPEELPVVLTIFLALGAWRMSKKRVLTRRVAAVETLGSATVLCVDKTGTLTLNRMTLKCVFAAGTFHEVTENDPTPLPETFHQLIEYSILAGQNEPFDPMEIALRRVGDTYLAQTEHLHSDWKMVSEYPLTRSLLSLSHVWQAPEEECYFIAAKGAPEAVFELCHLDDEETARLSAHVQTMAARGLRVLGVAEARFTHPELPPEQHDFTFSFLGLVGFEDPIRPSVPAAIEECTRAGIRVVMITGDYPATAQSIARQIGLRGNGTIITGHELSTMSEGHLEARIGEVNVFARVVPEQKLQLVNALKANGEVVAMTGDGVNDAPALKAAHIGIVMGKRGTDVAREASALVLLDDDFSSIVEAVRMGRRIFENLRKAMAYIFAIHVPIAGMSLLPVLFGWPPVLFPVHIAFLEMIIDPACSTVFEAEPEDPDIMKRPPRDPSMPLFSAQMIGLSLLQGLSVLLIMLGIFVSAMRHGHTAADARTLAFTSLVIANLALILANRSWTQVILKTIRIKNPALWWVMGGTLSFLALVLCVPALRGLFKFDRLHPEDIVLCLVSGIVSVGWFELLKLFRRKK